MADTPEIVTPDLDKLRDEKVIPVAKMVLNDLAVGMIPTGEDIVGNFQEVTMQIMRRALDADFNILLENTYLFQLLTTVLGQFTTTMLECDMAQPDDARYITLAKEVLTILATENIAIGELDEEKFKASFADVKSRLNDLFAHENLNFFEVKYIMANIMQSYSTVQQTFSNGVDNSVKRMETKILGIEDMSDLTMKKLDETLVKPE